MLAGDDQLWVQGGGMLGEPAKRWTRVPTTCSTIPTGRPRTVTAAAYARSNQADVRKPGRAAWSDLGQEATQRFPDGKEAVHRPRRDPKRADDTADQEPIERPRRKT